MTRPAITRTLAAKFVGLRLDWPLWLVDAALVALAYVGVVYLRFDGSVPQEFSSGLRAILPVIVLVHLGANAVAGVYGRVWRQASIEEARRLLVASLLAAVVVAFIVVPTTRPVPASTVVTGGALTLLLLGGARFQSRVFAVRRAVGRSDRGRRVVIVGGGPPGAYVVRDMLENPDHGLIPVAVVDEDSRLHGRRLSGVPVVGGVDDLDAAVERHRAEVALLATTEAPGAWVREVVRRAGELDLEVKVLPTLAELVRGAAGVRDVRDLSIDDLLGRKPVVTDLREVEGLLRGRRVLITGGGGSIGSEIAHQVSAFEPEILLLLDHDETHLHDAMARVDAPAVPILADIRDPRRVEQVFRRFHPEIVFHAAAHKHVPVLEANPCEAITTNVVGTDTVLSASVSVGVEHFVLVSTDKAVRPVSVMGATKRIGEQLVLLRCPPEGRYCAVRFGNVLGSRGSVVPTFVRQIQTGGPVTVTDPEMTRFFMSIPEAVQLVLQAAAMSQGEDLFMLEMGEPVRIVDLARRMIDLSGARGRVDIEYMGLRPGEKLAEELREPEEVCSPTRHPGILALQPTQAPGPEFDQLISRLGALAAEHRDDEASTALFDVVASLRVESTEAVPTRTIVIPEQVTT